MHSKKHVTIIMVVAVMVSLSFLGSSINSTGSSQSLNPTTVTLTASSTTPAVNQVFTLGGQLSTNGAPLPNKQIALLSQYPPGTWNDLGTAQTNANGTYSFNRTEASAGAYAYQVSFSGDAQYSNSSTGRTVDVGDLRQSTINIFASNTNPGVNQAFTLYGVLTDGVSGTPLADQLVRLIVQDPSGRYVNVDASTFADGSYSFNRSEASQGTYFYQVYFLGNSEYFQSEAMIGALTVGNPIQTTLSVTASNSTPAVGQPFTFSGYLKDVNGTALSGRVIDLVARYPNGNSVAWGSKGQTTTDANGHFAVTYSEQTSGAYWYEFWCYGDGNYATTSGGARIAVGTLEPTSVSLNSSFTSPAVSQSFTLNEYLTKYWFELWFFGPGNYATRSGGSRIAVGSFTSPAVSQSFTLNGYLTDANGTPLARQEIDLYRSLAGQETQPATRFTDQNGYYFFDWSENTQGSYRYTAVYNGDQNHSLSQTSVEITVGSLAPTTLSLTTASKNPAVNETFTLSGTLTANGTPLSGRQITLISEDPSGTWNDLGNATTLANGFYSFNLNEVSPGHYGYQTNFDGDNTYSDSYASSGADVGS